MTSSGGSTPVKTEDSAVAAVKAAIGADIDTMTQSANQVNEIVQSVAGVFQSHSSSAWQSAIEEWSSEYAKVISTANAWLGSFTQAQGGLSNADDDSTGTVSALSTSMFQALGGN